jgi:hypothetical protein
MTLFPLEPPDDPRPRRTLWRHELLTVMRWLSDERARDRRRADEDAIQLSREMADMRIRLRDLERAVGVSNIRTAPRTGSQLKDWARS